MTEIIGILLLHENHLKEMSEWCYANVGGWVNEETSNWTWAGPICTVGRIVEFKFRHQKDAMFFALRWK